MSRDTRRVGVVVALALLASASSRAATVFDFEAEVPTYLAVGARPGALISHSITVGSLTATFTRPTAGGFVPFDLTSNVGGQSKDPAFGGVSLDPFFDTVGVPFLVDFSSPVTGVSVVMGDYNADGDDLFLEAYTGPGGTGGLVGFDLDSLTAADTVFGGSPNVFKTLSVGGGPILSVVMMGGSPSFPNSVFYDNLTVDTGVVPEPGTCALLGFGALALRRRRRAA